MNIHFQKISRGWHPGPPLTAGTQPVRQRRTGWARRGGVEGEDGMDVPNAAEIVGHPTHEDEENGISPSMIAVMMAEIDRGVESTPLVLSRYQKRLCVRVLKCVFFGKLPLHNFIGTRKNPNVSSIFENRSSIIDVSSHSDEQITNTPKHNLFNTNFHRRHI